MALIIIFLLFVLQFFYFPIGTSFFEGAKVYFAEVLIFIMVLVQFFSKGNFSLKQHDKRIVWCAAVLFGITLYHLALHQTQTLLFGNIFRLQGTALLWMLLVFAFISSRVSIEDKIKPLVIIGFLFAQLVCTIFFIGVGADRPVGTIGEPNALAASVLFLWPFIVFAWPKRVPMKLAAIVGLLCAFIILFVSGSRSGFIALAVQLSFLIIFKLLYSHFHGNDKSRIALKYATVISLVILLASYVTPFMGPRTEYEDRGEIWSTAVHAGMSHPIAGVGFGNAEYEYHKTNIERGNKLQGYYVDSAHNIFLDWFVQAGILGLGVLLFLLYQAFRNFISKKEIRNSVLLLGLLTALSFNPASVVSLIALWWIVGQGMVTNE